MTENQLAKRLEREYLQASKCFKNFLVTYTFSDLKENNLNYDILKEEVEKLGYCICPQKDLKVFEDEYNENVLVFFNASLFL